MIILANDGKVETAQNISTELNKLLAIMQPDEWFLAIPVQLLEDSSLKKKWAYF